MNSRFLWTAKQLKPTLTKSKHVLTPKASLAEGEHVDLDFGDHYVGHIHFVFQKEGRHPDSPALLHFIFGEKKWELEEDNSAYHGWIAKSWIQEEWIHIDEFPAKINLSRRYAFRYCRVELLGCSQAYRVLLQEATLISETSAPEKIAIVGETDQEKAIDRVSLRTLSECMQDVFEDGPKRDHRLWLGDLRLQALVNYQTYRHNDLVKRCLYLFAGTADKNGVLSASVFTKPKVVGDGASMSDYSLLFIPTVYDYFKATKDKETLLELLPLMRTQIKLADAQMKGGVFLDPNRLGWCFIDWSLELKKRCACTGVYLYALRELIECERELGYDVKSEEARYQEVKEAAKKEFYDEKNGLFFCDGQLSFASNIWMVLGGVLSPVEGKEILLRLEERDDVIRPVTPYMMHHYLIALYECGLTGKMRNLMNEYWGKMVQDGADTFYELFDPEHPDASPYGSRSVNSYCHAWSCTPSYLLRKYFLHGEQS